MEGRLHPDEGPAEPILRRGVRTLSRGANATGAGNGVSPEPAPVAFSSCAVLRAGEPIT